MDKKVFTPNEFLEELSTQYGLTLYPDDVEALLGLKKGTLVEKNSPQVTISIKPRNN